jgi:predicted  nucleic acid-binding Zn-ribbon protein
MNVDLKQLIRLQAVDLAVAELRGKTEAFPEKSKALDVQLRAAQDGVEQAKRAIQANEARRKELESRIADIESKTSKYKEQLMSVRTNEEYRAMTKEIEYGQEAISKEEDGILVLMEESESLESNLRAAQERLSEDEQSVQAERARLEELNKQDTIALEAYLEERAVLEEKIDVDILFQYERVRKARGGIGLAPASNEACEICNVRMRPQIFQEVRKNSEIIACDSCGRILYDPENLDHPFEVA